MAEAKIEGYEASVWELGQKWRVMGPPEAFQPQVLLHSITLSANIHRVLTLPGSILNTDNTVMNEDGKVLPSGH